MAQRDNIEDVLSSIRRLVSTEAPLPPKEDARGPTAEALVLDPAQRVTEPEDPFQMIRSLAQEERDGRDAGLFTNAVDEDVAAIVGDLSADDADLPSDWSDSDDEIAFQPKPSKDAPVEKAAQPQAEMEDVPEGYAEDTDYQPEIAPIEEVMGLDIESAAPVTTPEAEQGEDDVDLADVSAALAGDDALRELIAEIVRQELAGELGERITRNVRKLVRRELRQLLATDEFD